MEIRNAKNVKADKISAKSFSHIEELENRQLHSASSADIGINVNDASTSAFNKSVPILKQMGITTVRLWCGVNGFTDRNFSGVLQRAIDYHNAGFDVMVVVNGNSNAVPNATDVKGWFQWAMSNSTLKNAVDRWEVGNEVDAKSYFSGTLKQYVDNMLKPAYDALHAAGEKVVSAGVSWNPADIQTMIGYGLIENCDYIGFHPYAQGVASQATNIKKLEDIVDGRRPLVASEWNIRGLENNKTAWSQAVEDAYSQVREGFAFNYYFCLVVQNTPAGPGAILNTDGSHNTMFWNAVSTFKSQAAALHLTGGASSGSTAGATTGVTTGNTAAGSTGTISGVLWNDDDGDGAKDSNEAVTGVRTVFIDANGNGKLDNGEKQVQSNAAGKFTFTGLAAGTYKISRVFPSGYRMSNSASIDLTVVLNPGQIKSDANIGTTNRKIASSVGAISSGTTVSTSGNVTIGSPTNTAVTTSVNTATIAGVLWNDGNANGQYDSNESVTGIRTVFIDTNGNGQLDAGERSTTSNAHGAYGFTGLSAGSYKISRVYPDGFRMSNANSSNNDLVVNLSAGQKYTGLNIGTTDKLAA